MDTRAPDDTLSGVERAKAAAARHAAGLVEEGMVVGLGSGSTAVYFVRFLGERARGGLRVIGVPTSDATARLAAAQGIVLSTLEAHGALDLDVDGADAIDPALNLVKGLGGALLREKIVAAAARRFAVIADDRKVVSELLPGARVPVEVVPFGWTRTAAALEAAGAGATRRAMPDAPDQPFVTDGGHYILDCLFPALRDPAAVAADIKAITGVVDHGLFIGMATEAIIGSPDDSVRVLRTPAR
jgi:ribose 5-phosphate isomerase A